MEVFYVVREWIGGGGNKELRTYPFRFRTYEEANNAARTVGGLAFPQQVQE
jgi:hypothetical protein